MGVLYGPTDLLFLKDMIVSIASGSVAVKKIERFSLSLR